MNDSNWGIFSYGMSDAGGTFLSGEGPDFSTGPSASLMVRLMVRLGHPHADMVPRENFTIVSGQTRYNHVKFDSRSPQVLIKTSLKETGGSLFFCWNFRNFYMGIS